jgi:hypothetical protein
MLRLFKVNDVWFFGELGIDIQVFVNIFVFSFDNIFLIKNRNFRSIDILISKKK